MATTPLRMLLRKDARSLAGKVGAMTAILASVVIATIARDGDDTVGIVNVFLGVYAVAGALFIATAVAAGERARDTLAFTRALPVSRRTIAVCRIGMGLAASLVPIVAAVVIVWLWEAMRPEGRPAGWPHTWVTPNIFISGGIALGSATMVYLLAVAAAAHQPSELRAAAFGLGTLLVWIALIPLTVFPCVTWVLVTASPVGLLVTASGGGTWPSTIITQVVVGLALFGLAVRRYGHLASPVRHLMPSRPASRRDMGHRGHPLLVLAWKEAREALPIVALGLIVTAVLTSWIVLAETHGDDVARLVVLKRTLIVLTYGLATFVALVVGVGTFVSELQPGLHEFWRTRPIGVARWFWFKTLTAGAIVLLAFSVPILAVVAVETTTTNADGFTFLACAPPLIIFSLTTAIAITCVTRHALYASILSLGVVLAVVIVPTYGSALDSLNVVKVVTACREIAQKDLDLFGDPGYRVYVLWMLGLAVTATGIGLAAVRRGWDLSRPRCS